MTTEQRCGGTPGTPALVRLPDDLFAYGPCPGCADCRPVPRCESEAGANSGTNYELWTCSLPAGHWGEHIAQERDNASWTDRLTRYPEQPVPVPSQDKDTNESILRDATTTQPSDVDSLDSGNHNSQPATTLEQGEQPSQSVEAARAARGDVVGEEVKDNNSS